MAIALIVVLLIVVVLVAVIVVLIKRRANTQDAALRAEADDHRAEAAAAHTAAAKQEAHAVALADAAKHNQELADEERQAATVKREVAGDLLDRADSIDPDLPSTSK